MTIKQILFNPKESDSTKQKQDDDCKGGKEFSEFQVMEKSFHVHAPLYQSFRPHAGREDEFFSLSTLILHPSIHK